MNEQNFRDLSLRDTERHLLVAVDESENSKRVVLYLADFFGDYKDIYLTLLSIIPEPSEDYFSGDEERSRWLADKKNTMEHTMAGYLEILLDAGFREKQISSLVSIRKCVSIGDAILEEQDKLKCCIVVVGRRGISHEEEFVFGSTSSKILHNAKKCAVLVVE